MDQDTLTALKASIEHWEDNATAKTPAAVSVDADDCALCNMFRVERIVRPWEETSCDGCPVKGATGKNECQDSPYHNAREWLSDWLIEPDNSYAERQWVTAAYKELDFLKSLLPGAVMAEDSMRYPGLAQLKADDAVRQKLEPEDT